MNRRRFLILSLTGVSLLTFDLGCEGTRRQSRRRDAELQADAQLHLEVLQSLFSPELVTPVIVLGTLHCDDELLSRLDLDRQKILALGADADAIARKMHGMGFSALDTANRESVIALVLERPQRFGTYKALRNLLFADPKYRVDPDGNAWQRLEYQSFDYTTGDAWQGG